MILFHFGPQTGSCDLKWGIVHGLGLIKDELLKTPSGPSMCGLLRLSEPVLDSEGSKRWAMMLTLNRDRA